MKYLVIYQTLSGSTMDAAGVVSAAIRAAGHEADMVSADAMDPGKLAGYQAIIIGSPSWEDEGMDGQPLPEVKKFIDSLSGPDLAGKKIAVFGLGDSSYPRFCGAVDVIEEKLKGLGVSPVIPSLRIDRYYSLPESETKITGWVSGLMKAES